MKDFFSRFQVASFQNKETTEAIGKLKSAVFNQLDTLPKSVTAYFYYKLLLVLSIKVCIDMQVKKSVIVVVFEYYSVVVQ